MTKTHKSTHNLRPQQPTSQDTASTPQDAPSLMERFSTNIRLSPTKSACTKVTASGHGIGIEDTSRNGSPFKELEISYLDLGSRAHLYGRALKEYYGLE